MKIELSIPLLLSEIANAAGGTLDSPDALITSVCTNTSEASEGTLFFALGEGEEYVGRLRKPALFVSAVTRGGIFVKDTVDALVRLASYYKTRLTHLKKTILITGSVGKTTLKDFTAETLASKFKVHKTAGNFNNNIGLPLSILSAPSDTEILVLEVGMNHEGEIAPLSLAVNPDIAVITNVGTAHIGNLGSRKAIAKAKAEVTLGLKKDGFVITPSDEPLLKGLKNAVTLGDGGDFNVQVRRKTADETVFDVLGDSLSVTSVSLPFGGVHFAKAVGFSVVIAHLFGMTESEIRSALKKAGALQPRPHTVDLGKFTLYDDSYNASIESYEADFELLSLSGKRTGAVIGDVLELGSDAEKIHEKIGVLAHKYRISKIYPFGKYAPFVAKGAISAGFDESSIFTVTNPDSHALCAELIIKNTEADALVLIKGSRRMKTEKITAYIKDALGEKND